MTRRLPAAAIWGGSTWTGTLALLVVAALTPGHFGDPAAIPRLVAYPLLMLLAPALWWVTHRSASAPGEPPRGPAPWGGFALVMAPFGIDTIGNVLDLYATISWWDDANHFLNWLLLCSGLGLVLGRSVRPRWALVVMVTGLGALLAIGWELGEWAAYYRGEGSARIYVDTLGDQSLGTLGALVAGLLVGARGRG